MMISVKQGSTVNLPQMDTDKHGFKHSEITDKIIKVFFEVYNELGHGFLESVYERSLEIALTFQGLRVFRQIQVPVWFRGKPRISVADLLIADRENDDLTKPS